jgi:ketosteroid isomerase-like protein
MSTGYQANLELVLVDWIGALRADDLDRIAELLDPDVEQRWIDGEVYCANREQMVAWIGRRQRRGREFKVDAVEVVGHDDRVVMSVRGPHLEWVEDEHIGGQISEVFTIRDGRIVAIRDYLSRTEALRAAGIERVEEAAWR